MEILFQDVSRKQAIPDEERFKRIFNAALRILQNDYEASAHARIQEAYGIAAAEMSDLEMTLAALDITLDWQAKKADDEVARAWAAAMWQALGQQIVARRLERKVAPRGEGDATPVPKDLVTKHVVEMQHDHFDGIVDQLVAIVSSHPNADWYLREVIKAAGEFDWDDNVGAAFIERLQESKLDRMAGTSDGRLTLSILYESIITGDVSEFEREQADRILMAKMRQIKPEDFWKMARQDRTVEDYQKLLRREGITWQEAIQHGVRLRTPIFPVRFMRVTPGYDYATPLARLTSDGTIRVTYPHLVKSMSMFKEELRTLGDVFGAGMELNPNEIVGIKDYETGGDGDVKVAYLPALALIDYSNRAIRSTRGKIIEVSIVAATMGYGGGAAAGGEATAATEATAAARWGTRLAKGAAALDRVANFIGIASFVINENRGWIVSNFGEAGKRLVRYSDIANSAASIYGIARLGQAGYGIVKDLRAASKAVRNQRKALTSEQSRVLKRLDEETDAMLKELDEAAAKSGRGATPTPGEKPTTAHQVDDPAAAKKAAKAEPGSTPRRSSEKPSSATDEIHASAKAHRIPVRKLEDEVADLRRQTANPENVRQPADLTLDAEMTARDGHKFERNRKERTWCRHSGDDSCELDLGGELNADVDKAIAKRDAKLAEIERQRKAREALPPRERAPKREPATKASIDPKAARAAQKEATKKAQESLQNRINDAKEMELQLINEMQEIKQSGKQRLSASDKAALAEAHKTRQNNLATQRAHRESLQIELNKLEITPYDRARAYSYSGASAQEVVGRARKVIDVPGQPKTLALVDEMSGLPVKKPSIDHVVSIDQMVVMDGWNKLRWPEQQALLSRVDNLRMMEFGANASKGGKPWAKWSEGRVIYGEKVWREMIAEERRLHGVIQKEVSKIVAGR